MSKLLFATALQHKSISYIRLYMAFLPPSSIGRFTVNAIDYLNRHDNVYTFNALAGVGVIFFLACIWTCLKQRHTKRDTYAISKRAWSSHAHHTLVLMHVFLACICILSLIWRIVQCQNRFPPNIQYCFTRCMNSTLSVWKRLSSAIL